MKTTRENDRRRFMGNGNWADADRKRRGWQVMCMHCGKHSKPVITSRDKPVPPDAIRQRLAREGWLIGSNANEDECQTCLEKTRGEAVERKQLHERNARRISHLHEMIAQLDQFLTDNVVICSTPEFLTEHMELIRAFGSLLDTAFICNMVPSKWKEQPMPYSRVRHLQTIWDAATADERAGFISAVYGTLGPYAEEPEPSKHPAPAPAPAPEPPSAAVDGLTQFNPSSPAPTKKPPAAKSISPKLAELRERARRQLN
jgi:hypothetical protein